ncbi:MAG: prealbumin-like fold domain-containing protein [Pyrinomonadaceae bacterium]|nr:prealbumin-like fold domain-containing protein [Pyrinomonadaceae bacterium]
MKRKRVSLLIFVAFALLVLIALAWVGARRLTHGVLLVSARISDADGRRAPAGSATLYLLDEDMMKLSLFKEGEMSPLQEKVFRENPKLRNLAGIMSARRREAYSLGPEVLQFVEQSRPLWQPHVLQSKETDAEGRATFTDLKPGSYWLMGRFEMRDGGAAFWNLFVPVKRGETSLTLEPANALQCSACR